MPAPASGLYAVSSQSRVKLLYSGYVDVRLGWG